ncbi:hypothetical protein [Phyllobacterium sp. K27]
MGNARARDVHDNCKSGQCQRDCRKKNVRLATRRENPYAQPENLDSLARPDGGRNRWRTEKEYIGIMPIRNPGSELLKVKGW